MISSLVSRDAYRYFASKLRAAFHRRKHIQIGSHARFGPGVRFTVTEGACIMIGDRVEIGARTTVAAYGKDTIVVIGDDVFMAADCIVAARESISIGRECMIAELVGIRDHDHDPSFPPKSGVTLSRPIVLGDRVWIGSKASVLRGGSVGDDAVVGAHALVNRDIPARSLAVGVPAVVVREGIRTDKNADGRRPSTEGGNH